MRIAVIADTHDRLPPRILAAIRGADEIWHLGDVCTSAIENELLATGIPLRLVRGNCDSNNDWPLTLDFTLEGFRIRLVHIPPITPTAAPTEQFRFSSLSPRSSPRRARADD